MVELTGSSTDCHQTHSQEVVSSQIFASGYGGFTKMSEVVQRIVSSAGRNAMCFGGAFSPDAVSVRDRRAKNTNAVVN